jgi:hypothetical protein
MAAICDLSSNFSVTLIDLIVVHLFLSLLELSFELLGPEIFDRHEFYVCSEIWTERNNFCDRGGCLQRDAHVCLKKGMLQLVCILCNIVVIEEEKLLCCGSVAY